MKKENYDILICDDSILCRRQMKKMLTSIINCNIYEAENGEVAVEKYKRYKPNIVFMDLVIPIKDGLETSREIITYDPKAYIIIISSVGTQKSIKESLTIGVKDFIQKPIDKTQLLRLINAFIEGGK